MLARTWGNPASLRFSELERLAGFFGFRLVRQSGSHGIYSRGRGYRKFSFQPVEGMAKAYQVRQFLAYLEEMGW